jgi:hypothetical protein
VSLTVLTAAMLGKSRDWERNADIAITCLTLRFFCVTLRFYIIFNYDIEISFLYHLASFDTFAMTTCIVYDSTGNDSVEAAWCAFKCALCV